MSKASEIFKMYLVAFLLHNNPTSHRCCGFSLLLESRASPWTVRVYLSERRIFAVQFLLSAYLGED